MYRIMFTDGSLFEGGNPANSRWNEIPRKEIQSIDYWLSPFKTFRLEKYEAYNHCVERVRGVNKNEVVSKVIIMGKTGGQVHQLVFTNKGDIFKTCVPYGKEYSTMCKIENGKFAGWLNGKALSGWLLGTSQQGSARILSS